MGLDVPLVASGARPSHPVVVSWLVSRALWSVAVPSLSLTVLGLVGASVLLLSGQLLGQSAVIPDLPGLLGVLFWALPSAAAVALPVGALVGTVSAGRSWREGGELRALAVSGVPPRQLLHPVIALGMLLGLGEALLTHHLEPHGRATIRRVLHAAIGDLTLRPGQPLALGGALLHARAVSPGGYEGLFVASGDTVIQAASGTVGASGTLLLQDGGMVSVAPDAQWRLSFGAAALALDVPTPRVELAERSGASLRALIADTEADGRSAAYERLVRNKRTSLPLSLPLLTALGLPLGLRGARPAAAAVGVVLGWWTLTRLCDQSVMSLGPLWAAAVPLLCLALATAASWARLR